MAKKAFRRMVREESGAEGRHYGMAGVQFMQKCSML